MANFLRKFLPESAVQRIRHAFLFRPEDPNGLHQVLPPTYAPSSVERIKGNRYPSPGSRLGASVPTRDNEDEIYNTSQLLRDARNLPRNSEMLINTTNGPITFSTETPRKATHGKRKIALLPYDPSGVRTTKTVTWDFVAPILDKHTPTHLPQPVWFGEEEAIQADREKKGLPPAVGKRYNAVMSGNYNQVRW